MASRILVTWSSPLGSAPEIGEAIAAQLRSEGCAAETAEMKDVISLEQYTAVVMGIPIYAGARGLGDVGNFAKTRFSEQLAGTPVAVFVVGLLPEGTPPDADTVLARTRGALAPITPAAMIQFCGTLDRKRFSFWQRCFMDISKIPSGEFQDWDAIRAWAKTLPELLKR